MKKTLHQHLAANGSPKKILSMDGGGIRGALTLEYLIRNLGFHSAGNVDAGCILAKSNHSPMAFQLPYCPLYRHGNRRS